MSYMVIIREPIKGSDDYMEAEYDGCEYADREGITEDCDTIEISLTWKKGESPKLTSKYVSTKLKVDYIDDYIPDDFCYVDTDSVKTEGPYRGGFTHTDSVKEDPDGT